MKTKLTFIVMTFICTCGIISGQKTIDILDARKTETGMATADHQDKDVQIFIADVPVKNPYMVQMYRMDNGKLKSYSFIVGASDVYDKAIYTWVNDTTMTFKLINSGKNISESFKMTAAGDHSTMSREGFKK